MNWTQRALKAADSEMASGRVGYFRYPTLELLRERILSATDRVPFYRELYRPFGAVPPTDKLADWVARLPIVTKAQLQAAGVDATFNPTYFRSDLVKKATSGSTGIPFSLYLDKTLTDLRKWRFQRPHQLLGEPANRLVFIFPWDFVARTPRAPRAAATEGESAVDGRTAASQDEDAASQSSLDEGGAAQRSEAATTSKSFVSTYRLSRSQKRKRRAAHRQVSDGVADGPAAEEPKDRESEPSPPVIDRPYTVNSLLPMDQLYEALLEVEPVTLIGFASTIAALARWMLEASLRLPTVRQIWTTSEVLSPEGADAIRSALGCEPLIAYASNEFGFMAWQNEPGGALCFESDHLYLETLRRDGEGVAAPGEPARLVITDLLNDTMPLIRYDIGDVARVERPIRVAEGVECAALRDLQGKEADRIDPPDGRTVTTFQVLGAIKDHLPNAQYRFLVIAPDRCVLQYRPGVGFEVDHLQPTLDELGEILGPEVEVLPQEVADIGREASGKLRPLLNLSNLSLAKRWQLAGELGIRSLMPSRPDDLAVAMVEKALAEVLPSGTPGQGIDLEAELYADLAIDSLRFFRLIVELEKELHREIDDEDLLDVDLITIADLVDFLVTMIPTEEPATTRTRVA